MSVVVTYQSHPPSMTPLRSVPEAEAAGHHSLPRGPQVGGPVPNGGPNADGDALDDYNSFAPPYPPESLPHIVFAHEQRMLKSEDVLYVNHVRPAPGRCHSLFMVCDGHQGVGAAQHVVQCLPWILERTLPRDLPDWDNSAEVAVFAEQIRRGISSAVVLADNRWTSTAQLSGTTMTLTIVSGWLITVANVGDSSAVLDTGDDASEITLSHRIQARGPAPQRARAPARPRPSAPAKLISPSEQARLKEGGGTLAPLGFHLQGPAKPKEMGVGPLRLWPGGLCVSRSIGDLDTGPMVVPLPHVRQMLAPQDRALRFIIASDGLWDLMSYEKAAKGIRNKLPPEAAASMAAAVVRDKRMADDMSLIVLDVLPNESLQFPVSALRAGATGKPAPKPSSGGGLFSCFKPPPEPVESQPPRGVQLLADVDCLQAYPMHTHNLARTSMEQGAQLRGARARTDDYTVHGARAHVFNTENSWHGSAGGSSQENGSRHAPETAHGGSIFGADAGMPDALAPPAPAGGGGGGAGGAAGLARVYTLPRDDAGAVCAGDYGRGANSVNAPRAAPGGGGGGAAPPAAARIMRSASATMERDQATDSYTRPQAGGGAAIGNIEVISRISGSAPADADSMLQQASALMDASEHGPTDGGGYRAAAADK
ncbi:MAG: phosphatase 2C-like domain-containing protein [Monoraphidium minutum]|nr:MAG: phosphatase 2C-like domain-containing protein [Monoraphidium minutum]